MNYKSSLRSLESQLYASIGSESSIKLESDGVFAGSLVDQNNPSSPFSKFKNLVEYEPGEPTEVPVFDGKPHLGLGMDVGKDFTSEDFDAMVNDIWEDARGYSTRELIDRINSGYGDIHEAKDVFDLIGVSASAALYKTSERILCPELKRTYRVDGVEDGIELFFIEDNDSNYVYLNSAQIEDYEKTLSGAEDVADYLDRKEIASSSGP
jgi:hypothetical protein